VSGSVGEMTAPYLALRKIEQHGWMVFDGIGLQEGGTSLLVSFLIEETDAFLKTFASYRRDRILVLLLRHRGVGGQSGVQKTQHQDDTKCCSSHSGPHKGSGRALTVWLLRRPETA
jgi:hypothetical protein